MRQDSFSTYHPAINFFYFAAVIILSMCFQHPVMQGISLVTAVIYAVIVLGPRKALRFNLLFMLPVLILTTILNPLFNHYGVTILGYFPNGNPITLESMIYGFVMGLTLITVMIWFACYNKVMTSDKFIYLFGRIIPSLSLIISMVLRFVPMFKAQMKKISDGQKCVGRDVSNGNILERISHGIKILSIMITWALENAIESADSMRARGYGLRGRTAFSLYRFDRRDGLLTIVMLIVAAGLALGLFLGYGFVQYNPVFKIAPLNVLGVLTYLFYAALCLAPTVVDAISELRWKKLRSASQRGVSMTSADSHLVAAMTINEDEETENWRLSA
ncbi:MAG: energy-coupling factor transporter transmembrane component T [Eubacterium sp.]|nr:energy-coupling factor transporter transmembrane component T [Eubacterium sp.]